MSHVVLGIDPGLTRCGVAVGACSAVAQRLPALEAALAGRRLAAGVGAVVSPAHLAPPSSSHTYAHADSTSHWPSGPQRSSTSTGPCRQRLCPGSHTPTHTPPTHVDPTQASLRPGPAVGDLIGLGISHPCTTFDKWRWLPVVDDRYNVIDAVTTRF